MEYILQATEKYREVRKMKAIASIVQGEQSLRPVFENLKQEWNFLVTSQF